MWMNGNACLLRAQGEIILQSLVDLSGKLSVRIAVNKPQGSQPVDDLKLLNQSGDYFTYVCIARTLQCNSGSLLTKCTI